MSDGIVPTWKREEFIKRLTRCRAMLNIHGCLSDRENISVRKRIEKKAVASRGNPHAP